MPGVLKPSCRGVVKFAAQHNNVSHSKLHRELASPTRPNMSIMRIAIAGTGGLARHIVHFIQEYTSHQVIFLSRTAQPQLADLGFGVLQVDYTDSQALVYALRGIDTVISTVTGPSQLNLIHAAVRARVRRFAPAEFEGPPDLRPPGDPLDRGHAEARRLLSSYTDEIQSTTFVCGIFYERFQPYGLRAAGIGLLSGFSGEGDYIVDVRNMQAQVPAYDANGNSNVTICLTAAEDVARFVTRAIDLPDWPPEFRIHGCRVRVQELAASIMQLKGQRFNYIQCDTMPTLQAALQVATAQRNFAQIIKLHTLLATAEGRYDFTQSDWHRLLPDEAPISFYDWLASVWNLPRQHN